MINDISLIDDDKVKYVLDGKEVECELLFTYDSPSADATYIGFTDGTYNDKGELNIMTAKASEYTKMQYVPVTDPEDLELMDDVIKDIIQKINND